MPSSQSHDEYPHDGYLELCAAWTTGALSPQERARLKAHLAGCASCREILAQYEAIVGHVLPAWAAELTGEDQAPSGWNLDQAERELFARLGEADTRLDEAGNISEKPAVEKTPLPSVPARPRRQDDLVWRHLWLQYAAAILLVAALGVMAYRIGVHKGFDLAAIDLASRDRAGTQSKSKTSNSDAGRAPTSRPASTSETGESPREVAALRSELEARISEIEHLKAELARSENEKGLEEAERIKFAEDRAAFSAQLETAERNLEAAQQKLDAATTQESAASAASAANASLDQKVDQLTASIGERDQEIERERELLDRERELLDKDRDIRELMGSRDLYIAEVYDVAKTGDTEKPFGRVFYTRGKSLIFYAYDLDQQPGREQASSFQAWGRIGPDRDRAVNLGILYQDNANKKRWVLKSENPKTLAEIDAVFVTVEPNGGSAHPSGKPLLFAYLKVQPNHP